MRLNQGMIVHGKRAHTAENRAPMIRYHSQRQLPLAEFEWPFQTALDENNRWVKLSECIPWDELAEGYYQGLSRTQGRPMKDARLVIGAVIIKHKLCLSDEETVAQIQENPYQQYFVGLSGYQMQAPFAPSLLVEIRKRMGQSVFDVFQSAIIDSVQEAKARQKKTSREKMDQDDNGPPSASGDGSQDKEPERQGKLILDATVAPQAIRYPTDLSLLNEAREFSEQIIDELYPKTDWKKKPRTYREQARKAYLAIAKQRRPSGKARRRGIKQQLQYLRRNLGHIERLLEYWPEGSPIPLPRWLLYRYWVIQHVYAQQWGMYRNRSRRCDDRIVSISQPYVRPIVRGKQALPVEFGAKLSVSLTGDGVACVDHLRWDAFHEGGDLQSQVEAYRVRHGHYPAVVLGAPVYGTRDNRRYLRGHGIRFAGKPLGRPKTMTEANREELERLKRQRREEYLQRIPIEGKFGQGKNGYRLNYIRAKRADTSLAWINAIFLVMNLQILLRIFFARIKKGGAGTLVLLWRVLEMRFCLRRGYPARQRQFVSDGGVLTY
jgi:IS5 family transposase